MREIKLKCPVCGTINSPVSVDIEAGNCLRVRAEYICYGKVRRIFRPKVICGTRYSVELSGDAARRAVRAMSSEEGT